MLIAIMGKGCSGKTSVVDELRKAGFKQIITYTSRPKRRGEKNGREYNYITNDDFLEKINDGFFAEWKSYKVNKEEWYYGSPLKEIKEAAEDDNKKTVIILTPSGISDIKSKIPNGKILVIYLYANRNTIISRMKNRRDKNDRYERRMIADDKDFRHAITLCDKIVYNNDDDKIQDAVEKIIKLSDKFSL